ncbi:oligosaccharide flippase family protein [Acidaminobacter hydrogenoformans]|nr:polysaccharide biosynthesis C-terminal domain-containing protein [Acidaminobacter hydrogenoformans]
MVLFSFVGSILINRFLGPSLKGEYSYLMNYVSIFSLVMTLSITKALPYFMKKYGDRILKQFINFIYLQVAFYLLISLLVFFVFGNKTLLLIFVFSSFSQFYQQISFIAMLQNINLKNLLSLVDLSIYTITLFLVFFLSDNNKLDIMYSLYAFKLVLSVAMYIIAFKIYPNSAGVDLTKFKEIFIFSIFPTISSLLITFNYKIDVIILKSFEDFTQIGLYSLGVTIAGMLWVIPDAFKDVLFNKTAKNDALNHITFSIKFNVFFSFIIILGFTVFGKTFISTVYGADFEGATLVTMLLLIGNISMIFFKMINTLYIARGMQKKAMFILAISVFSNIVLNYILIPLHGINGAAFASVLSYSLCGLIFLYTFMSSYNLKVKDVFLFNKNELDQFKLLSRRKR